MKSFHHTFSIFAIIAIFSGCGGGGTDTTIPKSVIKDITDNYTITRGDTLTLDGSNSTDDKGIVKYTWMLDEEIVSNEKIDELRVKIAAGKHKVCLITEDADGKRNKQCKNINVIEPEIKTPTAIINNIPNSGWKTKCKITLSAKESTAIVDRTIQSYKWYKDGNLIGNEINQTISFDNSGNHTISLEVTDNVGDSKKVTKSVNIAQIGKPTVKLTFLNPFQRTIFSDQTNENQTWGVSDSDQNIPSEGNHVFFSVEGSFDDCNLTDDNITYIWDGRIYKEGSGTVRDHCFAQKPFLRKIHRDFNTTGNSYPSYGTVLNDDPTDYSNMGDQQPTRVSQDIYEATKYIYPYDTSLSDNQLGPSLETNHKYVYLELCEGQNLDYDRLEIKVTAKDNLHNTETTIVKTIKINAAVSN